MTHTGRMDCRCDVCEQDARDIWAEMRDEGEARTYEELLAQVEATLTR